MAYHSGAISGVVLYRLEKGPKLVGKWAIQGKDGKVHTETLTRVEGAKTEPGKVSADPGNLLAFRGQSGKAFYFEVTGTNTGPVWGTDIYTDDSRLSTAAVHAGLLQVGQKAVLKVTILLGQASYQGSERNGVATGRWEQWGGSYRIEADGRAGGGGNGGQAALPDPGTLTGYRGKNGQTFLFEVTGNGKAGTVWGTDLYTDDSALAAAVVHAGLLAEGQKGAIKVIIHPGADRYEGSERNGVSTRRYDSWGGSYRLEAVKAEK